jgi:hydrogenase expression/formation protein HypE
MKVGKLNSDDLKQILDGNRSVQREDVRIRSGIGEDCSIINFGDYECVISTDPITGSDNNIGKLAVHINCNDIASCGVPPIGILVTILAPEKTTLEEINAIMKEIDFEAKKLNVEILGGHTEITTAVNRIVVSCTAIGKGVAGKAVPTQGAKLGDDILVTKYLAMEGTSIVINDHYDRVKSFLTQSEMEEGRLFVEGLSVVPEGIIAGEFGVNSMHDITEGGVLGALWEMAEASNVGFKVYKDKMPISNVTMKICSEFNIDPLKFISSGSMLITTKNGKELIEKLKENGIKASIIGNITKENGIIENCGVNEEVSPPERDELFVFMDKIKG